MLICVDLDGTLLDTVPANGASYRAALEEQGFTVSDEYYAAHCNGGYYKNFLRPWSACTTAKKRCTGIFWTLCAPTARCWPCCRA